MRCRMTAASSCLLLRSDARAACAASSPEESCSSACETGETVQAGCLGLHHDKQCWCNHSKASVSSWDMLHSREANAYSDNTQGHRIKQVTVWKWTV